MTQQELAYLKIVEQFGEEFASISNSIPEISSDNKDISVLKKQKFEFSRCIKEYNALKNTVAKIPMAGLPHILNDHKRFVDAIVDFIDTFEKMSDSVSLEPSSIDRKAFNDGYRNQSEAAQNIISTIQVIVGKIT
jgi:hypothetical protein